MTVLSELKALSLSPIAQAAVAADGNDLPSLVAHAEARVVELRALLKQIAAVHPSRDRDTRAFAALNAVLAQLA
jgi:hypothetical protein